FRGGGSRGGAGEAPQGGAREDDDDDATAVPRQAIGRSGEGLRKAAGRARPEGSDGRSDPPGRSGPRRADSGRRHGGTAEHGYEQPDELPGDRREGRDDRGLRPDRRRGRSGDEGVKVARHRGHGASLAHAPRVPEALFHALLGSRFARKDRGGAEGRSLEGRNQVNEGGETMTRKP